MDLLVILARLALNLSVSLGIASERYSAACIAHARRGNRMRTSLLLALSWIACVLADAVMFAGESLCEVVESWKDNGWLWHVKLVLCALSLGSFFGLAVLGAQSLLEVS